MLILLYGCTTWTLTKRLEKRLDGNYTRMLRAILNKSWRQHPTKQQLYGHLPPITKTIQARWTRHSGHCWRSRDKLISDVLVWTPSYGWAKAGWPAQTYIQQLCEYMGYSPEDLLDVMNDREKWREWVRDICADGMTRWWWWWWWWLLYNVLQEIIKAWYLCFWRKWIFCKMSDGIVPVYRLYILCIFPCICQYSQNQIHIWAEISVILHWLVLNYLWLSKYVYIYIYSVYIFFHKNWSMTYLFEILLQMRKNLYYCCNWSRVRIFRFTQCHKLYQYFKLGKNM